MSDEDKLAAAAVAYGLDAGSGGVWFSHLKPHASMVTIQKERVEPSAVYRWLMASGLFVQDPVTRYLRIK